MDNIRDELLNNVNSANSFLILTHQRPDGDAVSSTLAMYFLLISLGKLPINIDVYIPYVNQKLLGIDKYHIIKNVLSHDKYDMIIIVDVSDSDRVEGNLLLSNIQFFIDHHEKKNIMHAAKSIIDPCASSCGCIIYREFIHLISREYLSDFFAVIASGIVSDTINLTVNVTDEAKSILAVCEKNGVDLEQIKIMLQSIDVRTKELCDLACKRINVKDGVCCTYILQSDLKDNEVTLKNVNHKFIIQQIMNLLGYHTIILLIENDKHEFKGSLRTTNYKVDLNQICLRLVQQGYFIKGGGHSYSSGFTKEAKCLSEVSINEIFDYIIKAISNYN